MSLGDSDIEKLQGHKDWRTSAIASVKVGIYGTPSPDDI